MLDSYKTNLLKKYSNTSTTQTDTYHPKTSEFFFSENQIFL